MENPQKYKLDKEKSAQRWSENNYRYYNNYYFNMFPELKKVVEQKSQNNCVNEIVTNNLFLDERVVYELNRIYNQ